jgi:hypothetical protein
MRIIASTLLLASTFILSLTSATVINQPPTFLHQQ